MIQLLTKSLVKARQKKLGISEEEWYARALIRLAMVVKVSNKIFDAADVKRQGHLKSFLFSGRRTPKAGFHLLMHAFLVNSSSPLKSFAGTSSLFAQRVFSQTDYLADLEQLTGKKGLDHIFNLVGTHAHEGSMVFQSYLQKEDHAAGVPISSLVWHMNYWLKTGILTVLPDTLGSHVFAYMLKSLHFPKSFVDAFNLRFDHKIDSLKPIYHYVQAARQDSGDITEFKKLFAGKAILASEISTLQDLRNVWQSLEIDQIGAGGVFGEKDWNDPSIVAKAVEVQTFEGQRLVSTVPTSKLGDGWFPKGLNKSNYSKFMKENKFKVDKLTVSPNLSQASRDRLVKQYLHLGTHFVLQEDSVDFHKNMQEVLDEAWKIFE